MDHLHLAAVVLTAAAGLAYLWAARTQWLRLGNDAATSDGRWWWIAFAAQSAGLAIALADHANRGFAYGVLAGWAGFAALLFASRFLSAPGRLLLALPLGAVALLLAFAGLGSAPDDGVGTWISRIHAAFMAAHLTGVVVAGSAGGLYLLASAKLRKGDARATRLPTLPVLERLVERGLVWGTALLIGGLSTGGAAMHVSHQFRLLHPTALLGLVELALLVTVLISHRARRLSRHALALAAVACLAVALLATVSQMVSAHG